VEGKEAAREADREAAQEADREEAATAASKPTEAGGGAALGKSDPVGSGCEVKIDVPFCFLSCFCLDN
jgi:hypothetical protein